MVKTKDLLTELRTKTEGELLTMLQDAQNELSTLTLNVATGKETETHSRGKLRKKIARIQTILKEVSVQSETPTQNA